MKTFTLFFLLFTVSQIYGQSNFKRGFIITNEQDTISGWIDFRTDAQNMAVCNFKLCKTCEVTTFLPGEIFGYRFYEEGKFYVSREIVINGEPRTVFLEFVVQGMMNLFYYIDTSSSEFGDIEYFFFEDQNGRMIPASRRPDRFRDERGRLMEQEDLRFRGVIRYLFNEQESISQQADRVRFNRQSMINVVREYHDLTCPIGEECIVFETTEDRNFRRFQFSAYGGALVFSDATAPLIGGRLNISIPRLNRNLSFQADLGIARAETQNDVVFHFPLQLGVKYAFGGESRIRPTVGLGTTILSYCTNLPVMGYASLGLEGQINERYIIFFDLELTRDVLSNLVNAFNSPFGANKNPIFGFLHIKAGIRF